jgi:hypothetical protein
VDPTAEKADRSGGQIGLSILGVLAALLAVVLLLGGAALVIVHATQRNGDGYYETDPVVLATPSYALVSDGLHINTDGPGWLFRGGRLGTVRIVATAAQAHPVFVGVGPASEVSSYLASTAHDVVTDFEVDPFSATYEHRAGATAPAAPGAQSFWVARASGSGRQTLTWKVTGGPWAVVVMNADAARGVRTDLSVGAKAPIVLWIGVGLLVLGGLVLVGSVVALRAGRRRRPPRADQVLPNSAQNG